KKLTQPEREVAITHTANILGRTFNELTLVYNDFATPSQPERLLNIIYWLGKLAIEEQLDNKKRTITTSPVLRERIGHHIHGEVWADSIKETLYKNGFLERPIHIISANMHSVMNTLFSPIALKELVIKKDVFEVYELLSKKENQETRNKVSKAALENGMIFIEDTSGTNIDVQIFDTCKIDLETIDIKADKEVLKSKKPIILVMDYAFGEQAYETIDELLKPYKIKGSKIHLNVESISIMGKAGILEGGKGYVMIPSAHIFEGTADNYPFKNELRKEDLEGQGVNVYEGAMITVLGTSLQNKDILKFFYNSTWNVIGLEME